MLQLFYPENQSLNERKQVQQFPSRDRDRGYPEVSQGWKIRQSHFLSW